MINLTIFKTEFKLNLRLVLVWTIIFVALIVLNLSLFDSVKDQQASVAALLKSFPPELMKAFSVNADSFATVEGYFSGKNLSLYLLAFSVLGVYLGSTGLGKELSSRTITFLATKPLSRLQIYVSKTLVAICLLLIADIVTAVASFLASRVLTSDHTASLRFFAWLFFASWLMQIVFLALGQLLSLWLNDTQAFLLGTGSVFVFWIVDVLTTLPGIPDFVKYLTPFHYVNAEYIHTYHAVPLTHMLALTGVGLLIVVVTAFVFHRKDFEA